jgi:hypothetical protein
MFPAIVPTIASGTCRDWFQAVRKSGTCPVSGMSIRWRNKVTKLLKADATKTETLKASRIEAAKTEPAFIPSNADAISIEVNKMVKVSKKIATDRAKFLSFLTDAAITVFEELTGAKRTTSVDSVKGILWSVSDCGDLDFKDPKYKWASELLLEAVRSAQMSHDFLEFRLNEGVFEVMEKLATPMIAERDRFDNVVKGSKVPNESEIFVPVPSKSVPGYFNLQYPGSVEKRGTKKNGVKEQEAVAASAEQVYADLAHSIADGTLPKSKAALQLIIAVYTSGITKAAAMDALSGIENEPTAVANAA